MASQLDRLSELRELYGWTQAAISDATPNAMPGLVKESRALLLEIAELEDAAPSGKPQTPLDEVSARRRKQAV